MSAPALAFLACLTDGLGRRLIPRATPTVEGSVTPFVLPMLSVCRDIVAAPWGRPAAPTEERRIRMRSLRLAGFVLASLLIAAAPVHGQSRRVAVLDFTNTSKDVSVEWLGPAVAETMTTKLNAIGGLQLVERLQLYKILEEQRLSLSDLVDPAHATRVGKLFGAEQVVIGAYSVFGGTVRFTARFVDVSSGAIVSTSQANGVLDARNPGALWTAFDRLASATIESLNARATTANKVRPTAQEQKRFAKPPTTSIAAQEAYGRGLTAFRKGAYTEAAREFNRAVAIDPRYAKAYQDLGESFEKIGRWRDALKAQETAEQIFAESGDSAGRMNSVRLIATLLIGQGRYDEARSRLEHLLMTERANPNTGGNASTLIGLGSIHLFQGRYDEAHGVLRTALNQAAAANDYRLYVAALNNLGAVLAAQGATPEALAVFQETLSVAEQLDSDLMRARARNNIGLVYTRAGRDADAMSAFEYALRVNERHGDLGEQARILGNIGALLERSDRDAEALEYRERSLKLMVQVGDEPGQARTMIGIASLFEKQRKYAEALRYYDHALGIAERLLMAERDTLRSRRQHVREQMRTSSSPGR